MSSACHVLLCMALAGCGPSTGPTADAGRDAAECVPVAHVCVTDEFGAIAPTRP